MSMRTFIRSNRTAIDDVLIRSGGGQHGKINDEERELWVLNDEALYLWARSEGVNV